MFVPVVADSPKPKPHDIAIEVEIGRALLECTPRAGQRQKLAGKGNPLYAEPLAWVDRHTRQTSQWSSRKPSR